MVGPTTETCALLPASSPTAARTVTPAPPVVRAPERSQWRPLPRREAEWSEHVGQAADDGDQEAQGDAATRHAARAEPDQSVPTIRSVGTSAGEGSRTTDAIVRLGLAVDNEVL